MKYNIVNKDKQKTIIFLNGAGVGQWMWQYQLSNLKDYKMITFDYQGHVAHKSQDFISMQNEIDKLNKIISIECKDKDTFLVGHSLGAQIAIKAIDILSIKKAIAISALNIPNERMLRCLLPFVKLTVPLTKYKWFAKLNANQLNVKGELFEQYYMTSKGISYTTLKNIYTENMTYKSGILDPKKVKVVVGENEPKMMIESAKSLSEDYTIIKGAGHDIPYNHYQALNKLIQDFFI